MAIIIYQGPKPPQHKTYIPIDDAIHQQVVSKADALAPELIEAFKTRFWQWWGKRTPFPEVPELYARDIRTRIIEKVESYISYCLRTESYTYPEDNDKITKEINRIANDFATYEKKILTRPSQMDKLEACLIYDDNAYKFVDYAHHLNIIAADNAVAGWWQRRQLKKVQQGWAEGGDAIKQELQELYDGMLRHNQWTYKEMLQEALRTVDFLGGKRRGVSVDVANAISETAWMTG